MAEREEFPRQICIAENVDVGHSRLVDLFKLADLAKPYYDWVEEIFQQTLGNKRSLSENLMEASEPDIQRSIRAVFAAALTPSAPVPKLFDGIGREYDPMKACYFFFAWLCRDAPQQRLEPIVRRLFTREKAGSATRKAEVLAAVFARMLTSYRGLLANFDWTAIREIIVDRLEGSRRAIKGHEKEIVVRTSLLAAIQKYFADHENYGTYSNAVVRESEITLDGETFDAAVELYSKDGSLQRFILVPVKTRETEGGGHSHIFTRDINSAIDASKQGKDHFVVAFIVAQNWSEREQKHVRDICDFAVFVRKNPNDFKELAADDQEALNNFVALILSGSIQAKTWESIRGLIAQE